MIEVKEMVLIWYGSKQVRIPKKRVEKVLVKENTKRYAIMWNMNKECYHKEFLGIYDNILEKLDKVNTIQIYQDDAIRLHLDHERYEDPKSDILIGYEDEIEILKGLCY